MRTYAESYSAGKAYDRRAVKVLRHKKRIVVRSSSFGDCLRKLWYEHRDQQKANHKPKPFPPMIGLIGNLYHDMASEAVQRKLPQDRYEVVTPDSTATPRRKVAYRSRKRKWKVVVTGIPDIIIQEKTSGKRLVIEFKALSNNNNLDEAAYDDLETRYRYQLLSYLWLYDGDEGVLWSLSKMNGDSNFIDCQKDSARVRTRARQFLHAFHLSSFNPPVREFSVKSFSCRFCPYRQKCWLFNDRPSRSGELSKRDRENLEKMLSQGRSLQASIDAQKKELEDIKNRLRGIHDRTKIRLLRNSSGETFSRLTSRSSSRIIIPTTEQQRLLEEGIAKQNFSRSDFVVLGGKKS